MSTTDKEIGILICDYFKTICDSNNNDSNINIDMLKKAIVAVEESFNIQDLDSNTYKNVAGICYFNYYDILIIIIFI